MGLFHTNTIGNLDSFQLKLEEDYLKLKLRKVEVVVKAAINCILPKEWKGVNYGGLERLVMFVDLDCRFDVLSLSRSLKQRIIQANGNGVGHNLKKVDDSPSGSKDARAEYDKELLAVSMRRFLYIRCYDSFEFLATLKILLFKIIVTTSIPDNFCNIFEDHPHECVSPILPMFSSFRPSINVRCLSSLQQPLIPLYRQLLGCCSFANHLGITLPSSVQALFLALELWKREAMRVRH
ncbi:DNA repair protein XRCC2 -like protein [Capsicum chinense]|nr:DNA repair protein XRCC2 -like protein [Capsicum chinense]